MKTILILGASNDYHAHYMVNACRKRNVKVALFDSSKYPQQHKIGWHPQHNKGIIELATQQLDFDDIHSVFWSSLSQCNTCTDLNTGQSQIALNDATSVLRTFLEEPSIRWVNSWYAFQSHKVKPRQLAMAADCGALIPESYIGNQATAIIDLVVRHRKAIYKPVYGGAYCALVTPDLLDKTHLERVLALAPVTIQEYIAGSNIRTFVIGDTVFSAKIDSNMVDFRDDATAKPVPIETPTQIQSLARLLNRKFNMAWTAIDWRRSEQGAYYFLEANPSPMFIHFEQQTGYPITDLLVDLLIDQSSCIPKLSSA